MCFVLIVFVSNQLFAAEGSYEADVIQAAHAGDSQSQFALAMFYEYGTDTISRHPEQAIIWLEKAAQGEVPGACLYLALKYEYGNRVKQNLNKAACWYGCAARKDWPAAQYFLAGLYEHGKGVSQSPVMALALYGLAAAYEYPGTVDSFSRVSDIVNDKDQSQVQAQMESFLKGPGTPCK